MRRVLLFVVIMLLFGSALVACSGAESPAEPGAAEETTSEETATEEPAGEEAAAEESTEDEAAQEESTEPISIGATVSLTGKYAESGEYYEQAYRLWEQLVNENGGLLGRPVEVIINDDKSDPDTGVSLYEKLITVDKVDLILGPYTSTVINPVSGVAEKYNMLFLQGGGNSPTLFERGFKYMFLTLPGLAADFPRMMIQYLDTLDEGEQPASAAIIFLDDQAMVSEAEGVRQHLEDLGIEVVYEEKVPPGVTDLTTTMSKVKESGAEVFFGHLFLPEGVQAVRAAKQVDYAPKAMWFAVGPAMSDWHTTLGDDGDNIWGSTMFLTTASNPGLQEFVDAFEEAYDRPPDYHAAGAYAAAQVLQRAVEETQSLDNDTLRDYVAANEFATVIGTLSWDEAGRPEPAVLLIQWQDGVAEIIYPNDAATSDPVYPMPGWDE